MIRKLWALFLVILVLLFTSTGVIAQSPGPSAPQTSLGTAFTYQGQLKQNGVTVNATCDMAFRLYDTASDGAQVGDAITTTVPVTNGLFTTVLDFGAGVFNGEARWLDIQVRCPAGSGSFTALDPRQALTAAPYALYALNIPLAGSGTASTAAHSDHNHDLTYWKLGGNDGVSSSAAILGTNNAVSLTLSVSKTVALRLFPTLGTPNIIGGSDTNYVAPGVMGATIGGGGIAYWNNKVSDDFGSVGGGYDNSAGNFTGTTKDAPYATIGGGDYNQAGGYAATVAGGHTNVVTDNFGTIGGGEFNSAAGDATVAGGRQNTAVGGASAIGGGGQNIASGIYATVPGGVSNVANGDFSFAAGSNAKANHPGAFVWADSTNVDFASTGSDQFLIRANGGVGINTNTPDATLSVSGTMRLNKNDLYLREGIDTNHGLGYYGSGKLFAGLPVDGPVLYGYSGGVLGTVQFGVQHVALIWTPAGTVSINSLGSAGSTNLCLNGLNQFASCSSSLRYKDNVNDLTVGLETIAKLRPVTFNWKDSGQADLGFVAEEVNQVTPLLTTLNKDGQIEGVKYDRITAVLVKGMQEQQQQIAELKAQNAAQQQEITRLKSGAPSADQSLNLFNLISVIALGGVIALGLKQKHEGRS